MAHDLIGWSSELMNLGLKFLHRGHFVTASLLSLSIPGQNHFSCNLSLVWSHPKWSFSLCTLSTSWIPSVLGTNTTLPILSFAFIWTHHSFLLSIMKFITWCLAQHLVCILGMSWFVRASTTSLSHGLSANHSCNCVYSSGSWALCICMMSLVIPWLASQSGQTDQSALLLLLPGPLASDHFL